MKKFFKWMFPLLFLLLCAGVFRFLWTFTSVKQMMQYISWDSILQVNEDGSLTPYTPDAYGNTGSASQVGKVFRLSAVIPEGLGTGTLLFETSGEELALWLNGTGNLPFFCPAAGGNHGAISGADSSDGRCFRGVDNGMHHSGRCQPDVSTAAALSSG